MIDFAPFALALAAAALGACLLVLREKHKADRRLKDAISVIPAGLGFYDASDRLYLWNKPYEEVSGDCVTLLRPGVKFRELIEADLKANFYADAQGREEAWIQERFAQRARGDCRLEQDTGHGRWLRVEDRRTSDGGVVSICTDITDLKERENSFKLLFDSNPVPMWLWEGSRSLRMLEMNQAGLDHLGYTAEQVAKLSVFDLLSVDDWPMLHEMIRSGLDAHQTGERIWKPRRADGTLRRALPYMQCLSGPEGKPRYVGAIVDVTDRLDAEDALRATAESLAVAKEEAEAGNRTKSEFLANMSHELRTPLNGVVGMAEMLASADLGPREREMVEIIRASGATLERLLSDVLDIVGVEDGRLSVDCEPFHLGDTVRAVADLFALKAHAKDLAFSAEISADADRAFVGDAVRLKQILGNLLSNAVKFTEAGEITLVAEADADGVRLVVRDTGVGFDPEQAERIFRRFEQADGSITRKYGGTGLGLSISRQLAELMGGAIIADGAPGRGATFTLTLPLAAVVQAEAEAVRNVGSAEQACEAPAEERPLRILVADDHPTNRKVVELMLASTEAELTSVENGLEALEAYCARPFDLILMDMQMPVMDGLTATTRIRDHENAGGLCRAPVIMLTANALPEHVRAAHDAGVDRHLAKPVTAVALISAIGEALDAASEGAAAAA